MDYCMTQACVPVILAKGKLSGRHPAVLKLSPSSDTGWLSLERICVTWPLSHEDEFISQEAPQTLMY